MYRIKEYIMNKSIKKIMAIAVILAMTMAQTIVFANNVGLDPNGHIEMPLNVKTNRPQNITIKNAKLSISISISRNTIRKL